MPFPVINGTGTDMAVPLTRRILRVNAVLSRREWQRLDRPVIVAGNATGLGVTLTASPPTANSGTAVTLTATVTGGNSPFTYTFTQTAGTTVTLSGSGNTRTFTLGSGTRPTFQVSVSDTSGTTATASVTINAPALAATLTSSPATVQPGTIVTLTAAASGGTPPYSYVFTQTAGTTVTLSGTGTSRTFTAVSGTNPAFRVTVSDTDGQSTSATRTVVIGSTSTQPRFAGHIPFRVQMGMATPKSGVYLPKYDEALGIITQARPTWDTYGVLTNNHVKERRIFSNGAWNLTEFREMADLCDSRNQLGVISFKPGPTNFKRIADGLENAMLNLIRDEFKLRESQNKPPHLFAFHHEPVSDQGVILSEWARMNNYCSNYFAGWGTDIAGNKTTYVAANDCRAKMTWCSIMNGNEWGPNNPGTVEIESAHPQYKIDTYRVNGSVLMADFYDGVPGGTAGNLNQYTANSNRTSEKIQAYITWHRDKNSGMLGAGEWSTTQAAEAYKVWEVLRANRDIFCIANYFNSGANSKWEWRLIPGNYPQNATPWALTQYSPGNGVEIGGSSGLNWHPNAPGHSTEEQLKTYRRILHESILPEWTSAF